MVRRHGGPEVLEPVDVPLPEPAVGQVRIVLRAIGINRRDAFIRAGIYKRDLPLIPGIEGAGVIDAIGSGVAGWNIGDRVVYYVPDLLGAYAEYHVVPVDRLVRLPEQMSFQDAAAIFDHGLTAHYLSTTTFPLQKGHRILVHAAAGGVGSLLLQFAKRLGATVFGTVSTPRKADYIKSLGADEAILYRDSDFVAAIMKLTNGQGVHAVYYSVGKDTVAGSVRCLAKRGMLILYGQSSGPVDSIAPAALADQVSLYFTRPHLLDHIDTPEELDRRSQDIFSWYLRGDVKVTIDHVYPFAAVGEAHRRLEDRARSGKILLIP
ncbi:MAG: quinone oxidoreductase [Proteobacteria bacterium]|nr:quinone oxidoreductase [Pseudomonadota bacterium]MDA1324301.1 quinone oxidoreductase [Pseudomonadota bacterium]